MDAFRPPRKRGAAPRVPLRSQKELAAQVGVSTFVLCGMMRTARVTPPEPRLISRESRPNRTAMRFYEPKEFHRWWAAEQLAKAAQPPRKRRAKKVAVEAPEPSVVGSSDLPGSNIVIISPEMDTLDSEPKQAVAHVECAPVAINLEAEAEAEAGMPESRLDGTQLERAAAPHVPHPQKQSTPGARNRVYQAAVDLTNQHRPASRQLIAKLTGFKLAVVDDHVKNLKNDGLLSHVVNGVVELTEHFSPDRPISITELPSGMVKYEIGDDVLELTPSEARRTGRMMGGFAQDAHVISGEREGRSRATQVAHLERQLWHAERRLADLMSGRVPSAQ